MTTGNGAFSSQNLEAIVESLLFVADAPVQVNQIADVLECDANQVEATLQHMANNYASRGLRLQRKGNRVQLVSAPEAAPYIERFLGLSLSGKLSAAALETLSIIAYKQPITRPQIEAIRGVSSDGVLRTLMSKGLIEEVGRLETVGHPVLFGTTFEFLQYFGISSLSELPPLESQENGHTAEAETESRPTEAPSQSADPDQPPGQNTDVE